MYKVSTTSRMSPIIALVLTLVCALLMSLNPVAAKAPVWEVKLGSNRIFLGGTIHLLSPRDYPLPRAFDTAYAQSQMIIFETDLSSAGAANTQAQLLPTIMSSDGSNIESVLNPATFNRFESFLQQRNLAISMFQKLTPAGINLSLLAIELQKLGITSESGVEAHFNRRALKDKKTIKWLESIEEQIVALNKMNEVDSNIMISTTLDDLEKLPEEWPLLLKNWRNGEMKALEKSTLDSMLEAAPELYDAVLTQRNKNWMPTIRQMLQTPETEFVLVGALHLAGEHSVLNMLNSPDIEIRQLD